MELRSGVNKKLSLIGAGNIGGTIALLALLKNYQHIVLFDNKEGLAEGKALDLGQAGILLGSSSHIEGTSDYSAIQNSDVIIVTAGSPRLPGMSRDDLLLTNAKVMTEVGQAIAKYAPDSIVICVTNPLDTMVYQLYKSSGLPVKRIMGMAGVLDTARFRYFTTQLKNTHHDNVQAIVLGGHGDMMVPLTDRAYYCGSSFDECVEQGQFSQNDVDHLIEKTRNGGAEIVQLLKTGSAYYAPALSAFEMLEAICQDKKKLLPVAAYVSPSDYPVSFPLFLGVPAVIGAQGVESIVKYPLKSSDLSAFKKSAEAVERLIQEMERLGLNSGA